MQEELIELDIFGTLWSIPEDDVIQDETVIEEKIIEELKLIPKQEEPIEEPTPEAEQEEWVIEATLESLDDIQIPTESPENNLIELDTSAQIEKNIDTQENIEIEDENESTPLVLPTYQEVEPTPIVIEEIIEPIIEEDTDEETDEETDEDENEDENEEETTYSPPILVYTPHTPKADSFGFLYPDTVTSIVDNWEVQIRCSLLAKENIQRLTWFDSVQWLRSSQQIISKWNAVDLVLRGQEKLRKVSPTELLSIENTILDIVKNSNSWSIVDLYMWRPDQEWVLKWHRSMAFVGADQNVYILDPIVYYKSSEAHHISTYIEKVWAWVERYIDPIPYPVHQKYREESIVEEEELDPTPVANLCDSSIHQEIILNDEHISITNNKPLEQLFLEWKLEIIDQSLSHATVEITQDVVIQIPEYPLVSIRSGTIINSIGAWFRDTMWLEISRNNDIRQFTRWNDDMKLVFDRPIEVIFTDIQDTEHQIFYSNIISEISHEPESALISHPNNWCNITTDTHAYTYMPVESRDDNLALIYMCQWGRLDIGGDSE